MSRSACSSSSSSRMLNRFRSGNATRTTELSLGVALENSLRTIPLNSVHTVQCACFVELNLTKVFPHGTRQILALNTVGICLGNELQHTHTHSNTKTKCISQCHYESRKTRAKTNWFAICLTRFISCNRAVVMMVAPTTIATTVPPEKNKVSGQLQMMGAERKVLRLEWSRKLLARKSSFTCSFLEREFSDDGAMETVRGADNRCPCVCIRSTNYKMIFLLRFVSVWLANRLIYLNV